MRQAVEEGGIPRTGGRVTRSCSARRAITRLRQMRGRRGRRNKKGRIQKANRRLSDVSGFLTRPVPAWSMCLRELAAALSLAICLIHEIVHEFRYGPHPGHEKVIPRPRTSDIQQVALGVVNLLHIRIVCRAFDSFL